MLDFLTTMGPWQWLTAAGILLLCELFLPSGFFLGMAAAATSVGLTLFVWDLDWQVQFAAFGMLAVVFTVLYWKFFKPFNQAQDGQQKLNDRSAQQTGRIAVIIEDPQTRIQKAQLGDTLWAFECSAHLNTGDKVRVLSAEGMSLIVEPCESE